VHSVAKSAGFEECDEDNRLRYSWKRAFHFQIGTPAKKSRKNLPIHPTQFAILKIEKKTNVTQAVAFSIFRVDFNRLRA
jgi:hypothetical protein